MMEDIRLDDALNILKTHAEGANYGPSPALTQLECHVVGYRLSYFHMKQLI